MGVWTCEAGNSLGKREPWVFTPALSDIFVFFPMSISHRVTLPLTFSSFSTINCPVSQL